VPRSARVSVNWVGDVVLGSAYGMPSDGALHSFDGVQPALRAADLTFGNLEQTLSVGGGSKCGAGSANCFAFQAPPGYASALRHAGFDVLNLANNHAADYGTSGEQQTIAALARAGLASTGRPGQIALRTVHGVRVALLGFAPYPWAARLDRIPTAARLVRRAAARADLVVVAIHAGAEGSGATHVPAGDETFLGEDRGDSRRFAHAVVDAGADLVVGSGPHVVRGIERYRGRIVAYSAGNFAGYHNFGLGGTLSLSGILHVTLRGDGTPAAGRWISAVLGGPGLPTLDPRAASAALVAQLSRDDFGARAVRLARDGTLLLG
jgi:hypothetical protein